MRTVLTTSWPVYIANLPRSDLSYHPCVIDLSSGMEKKAKTNFQLLIRWDDIDLQCANGRVFHLICTSTKVMFKGCELSSWFGLVSTSISVLLFKVLHLKILNCTFWNILWAIQNLCEQNIKTDEKKWCRQPLLLLLCTCLNYSYRERHHIKKQSHA